MEVFVVFDDLHPYPDYWPILTKQKLKQITYVDKKFKFVFHNTSIEEINISNNTPEIKTAVSPEVQQNNKIVLKDKTPLEVEPKTKVEKNNKSKSENNANLKKETVKSLSETLKEEQDRFLLEQEHEQEEEMAKTPPKSGISENKKTFNSQEAASRTTSSSNLVKGANTSASTVRDKKMEPTKNETKSDSNGKEGDSNRKGQKTSAANQTGRRK